MDCVLIDVKIFAIINWIGNPGLEAPLYQLTARAEELGEAEEIPNSPIINTSATRINHSSIIQMKANTRKHLLEH